MATADTVNLAALSRDELEVEQLQEDAHLSLVWEADGSLALHGRLAAEDGARLLRALEAVREARWKQGRGQAEPRPTRQASYAEPLVALAEAALARPSRRAEQARFASGNTSQLA
jgi:hypothetical protein